MDGPTIIDVAKRAYVSRSTASLALSNRADRVSPDTRERVLAAARELGYRVNPTGSQLRSGGGGDVAFIYHPLDEFELEHGSGPMWARFAMTLGMELGKGGYRLLMLEKSEASGQRLYASAALAFAETTDELDVPEFPFGVPVWVASPGPTDPHSRISFDFTRIASDALTFLAATLTRPDRGNIRVAVCVRGVQDPPFTAPMLEALERVGAQLSITVVSKWVDPRDDLQLEAFIAFARAQEIDVILSWGVPIPQQAIGVGDPCDPVVFAFCENELPTEFAPATPHLSFCLDGAARQISSEVSAVLQGREPENIVLGHKLMATL